MVMINKKSKTHDDETGSFIIFSCKCDALFPKTLKHLTQVKTNPAFNLGVEMHVGDSEILKVKQFIKKAAAFSAINNCFKIKIGNVI